MTRPGNISSIYNEIHNERVRAHYKHGPDGNSMEQKNWDSERWLPVLMEEVGEVARVFCERNLGKYGPWDETQHRAVTKDLREELIQVAAMAAAWIAAIDETTPPADEDNTPERTIREERAYAARDALVEALQNQAIDEEGRVILSLNVRGALAALEPFTSGSLLEWAIHYTEIVLRSLRTMEAER